MGRTDVRKMCSEMTSSELQAWKVYDELDPFGEERMDYRIASIPQALWNIARDQRRPAWPLKDFLVYFGDNPMPESSVVQPVEFQERLIETWIISHNLALEAAGKS